MTSVLVEGSLAVSAQMTWLANQQPRCTVVKATLMGDNATYLGVTGWIRATMGVADIIYVGRIGQYRHVIAIVLDSHASSATLDNLYGFEELTCDPEMFHF